MESLKLIKELKEIVQNEKLRAKKSLVADNENLIKDYNNIIFALESITYNVIAKNNEFPINDAPEDVYIYNLEKQGFWKGYHGYTKYLDNAKLFGKNEAIEITKSINSKNKIVYF